MGTLIEALDQQFAAIDNRSQELLHYVGTNDLFLAFGPAGNAFAPASFGEALLRAAATVERTFGGITTRLWDDPFEWTLPEKLSDHRKISEYLSEAESARRHGFTFFNHDEDLSKTIPAPEEMKSLFNVLLETLALASHYQGRAAALAQIISGSRITP